MQKISEELSLFFKERCITQEEIAQQLGVTQQYVSSLLSGKAAFGKKQAKRFAELYGIQQSWLLTGEGEMLKGETQSAPDGIPLIPNEAFAGYGAYQYNDLPTEEVYQIKEFRHASFLLRVSGDSMSPKYHSGDLVACQKIEEVTFWQWHRIYAISTKNQGILLKRIEKSDTPESVTCVSENPAYTPFELNNQEIVSVALVLGGVVME
jgi:phage repressor protein C with HTH and peptisase S24 domain